MPEGDTIRRLADRLDGELTGHTIVHTLFRHNRWATTDLSGLRFSQVDAVGKHLLMRLADPAGAIRVVVHSHLRMNGSWTVGVPPRTPPWRRRVELTLDDGRRAVGTDLPVLDVGSPRTEARWVGHLGPDLCAPSFSVPTAVANLTAASTSPLGGALLDQRNLAGIGNLYAVEIPFLVGVSPWTPVADLSALEVPVRLARALLPANAVWGPQSTTGYPDRARLHWVYGRRGQSCPVCGAILEVADERDVPWGRVTTWCPGCQTGVRGDLVRARHLLRAHRTALANLDALEAAAR